jgi:hypothetical protein
LFFLIYDVINHEGLWNVFFDGVDEARYSIYVHYKTDTPLRHFERHKVRECIPTEWANISLVKAQNVLLREALIDADNTSFIFLSGACIPLKRFDHVYDSIGAASYFNMCPHAQCFPRCDAVLRFLPKERIQKAHQWCILNAAHARMMVDHTEYLEWFERVSAADEHCYISFIFHRGLQHEIVTTPNLADGAKTFVNWGAPYKYAAPGAPVNYASIATDELAYLLRGACLFGRKFKVECAPSLTDATYVAAISTAF